MSGLRGIFKSAVENGLLKKRWSIRDFYLSGKCNATNDVQLISGKELERLGSLSGLLTTNSKDSDAENEKLKNLSYDSISHELEQMKSFVSLIKKVDTSHTGPLRNVMYDITKDFADDMNKNGNQNLYSVLTRNKNQILSK